VNKCNCAREIWLLKWFHLDCSKTRHVSDCKASLQLSELHYYDVLTNMTDDVAKTIHCLQDSGTEISIVQKHLIRDMAVHVCLGHCHNEGVIDQPAEATYLRTKWYPDPFSRLAMRHGQRWTCTLSVGQLSGSHLSNTVSPRPTSISSGILIHLIVATKKTLQTDRQTDKTRQRSHSIRRPRNH